MFASCFWYGGPRASVVRVALAFLANRQDNFKRGAGNRSLIGSREYGDTSNGKGGVTRVVNQGVERKC